MTMRLADKVVIVTGSTGGIGRAIAERIVAEGGKALVHGIDRAEGEKTVAELGAASARLCLEDLLDPAAPARIVAAAVEAFGRVDGLVNNAAIVPRSTLATTNAALFDRTMAINVRGPLLLIQAAWAQLKARRGAVLNIGSINAMSGEATLLDYSLSKGALQTLTRNLANAHAEEGVRFTCFNVGWVLTEREYAMQISEGQPKDWPERVPKAYAPSGRLLKPEEIAAGAIYWLSDEPGPITGAVVDMEQFSAHGRNPVKV